VLFGSLLVAVVAAGWVGVRLLRGGIGTSHPGSLLLNPDGPDWTYQELLAHLRSKGLTLRMTPWDSYQLYVMTDNDEGVSNAYWRAESMGLGRVGGERLGDWEVVPPFVACRKMASAKAAKEEAESYERNTFYWGRFYFHGQDDDQAFRAIRRVLLGK
jgi:hypothetical protein